MFQGSNGAIQTLPFFKVSVVRIDVRPALPAKKNYNTTRQQHCFVSQGTRVQVAGSRHLVHAVLQCRVGHRIVESVLVVVKYHYRTAFFLHHVPPEGQQRDLNVDNSISRCFQPLPQSRKRRALNSGGEEPVLARKGSEAAKGEK